jgi:hypothetical protein
VCPSCAQAFRGEKRRNCVLPRPRRSAKRCCSTMTSSILPSPTFMQERYQAFRKPPILTPLPFRSSRKRTYGYSAWRLLSSARIYSTIGIVRASSFFVSPGRRSIVLVKKSTWFYSSAVRAFEKWDATLAFSLTDASTGSLNVKIQADSVNTGSKAKDNRLKGENKTDVSSRRSNIRGPTLSTFRGRLPSVASRKPSI